MLGFNAGRQQQFLSRIGLGQLSTPMMALLIAFMAIITIAPIAFMLRGLGQRRLRITPAERAWNRISRRLRKYRLKPQIGETALEFAERSSIHLRNGNELIEAAQWFYLLHYAPIQPDYDYQLNRLIQLARKWCPELNSAKPVVLQPVETT